MRPSHTRRGALRRPSFPSCREGSGRREPVARPDRFPRGGLCRARATRDVCPSEPVDIGHGRMHNSRTMNLAELLEQQVMALPPEERKKLAAKLLASVSAEQPPRKRRAGSAAGRIHMAPDFDAPLEDFVEYS